MEVVDFATVTNRFSHDALGRRVAATDGRGNATSYVYDPFGRVLSTTDPAGFTTSFAYDEAGRRVSATDPLGNTVHTDYDAAGRVVAESGAKIEKRRPTGSVPVSFMCDEKGSQDFDNFTLYHQRHIMPKPSFDKNPCGTSKTILISDLENLQ